MSPARADRARTSPARAGHRRVLAQVGFETVAVLRNGEQLLLTFFLPLLALAGLLLTDVVPMPEPRAQAALAGAVAMALVATSFTSQAIAIAFDRRWGVLRMLGTTPLGPRGLLLGKLGAVLCVVLVQLVALAALGLALGWRPALGGAQAVACAVFLLLGAATFVSLALLVGGTLRPEAVLALANVLFVLMVLGGGLVLPLAVMGEPLATIMALLPPGALGEGLRTLATEGLVDVRALGALAVWSVLGGWLATRSFRWAA